jgi:hypothetical protein
MVAVFKIAENRYCCFRPVIAGSRLSAGRSARWCYIFIAGHAGLYTFNYFEGGTTPTSDVTSTSSSSSKTSSSTVDLPAITLVIFEKKLSLVFPTRYQALAAPAAYFPFFKKIK